MNEDHGFRSELWELIHRARSAADPRACQNFRQLLLEAVEYVDKLNRDTFRRGDQVEFTTRKGDTLFAVIERISTKSATVTVVAPADQRGRSWRVALSLITKSPAADSALTPLTLDEVKLTAIRACGAPPDGFDFVPNHLAEREGQHLIFVSTPAHGYFVVVSKHGRPQIVGEEDCGISVNWVTRFFGVDRFGQAAVRLRQV